ncbi:MAG TPA: hypothetical protein PK641_06625, partial [Candidatus Enterocola sp.]|nr:hypothetical protein [Candidatus Enterocola sp.]
YTTKDWDLLSPYCGLSFFETLPANLGKATSHNMAYYKSYPENKYRAKFYKLFSKEKLPLAKMVTISLRPSIRMRIINKIKRLLEL